MDNSSLSSFVDSVASRSHLRVEEDLGDGFVRLRAEEAQRRQAAQDIRCFEDAVIEMLRNSRDANARNIFVATGTINDARHLLVIDDGDGIPHNVHREIFQPCVTSKLDSFHMDKWGIHGRGMALFSIKENTDSALVCASAPQLGSSIKVVGSTNKLSERVDQSTFPQLTLNDAGKVVIKGPKNILRTSCEFALEYRKSVSVYVGSYAEIASTLYWFGRAGKTSASLAFNRQTDDIPFCKRLSYVADASEFNSVAQLLGFEFSERTAYRIMSGKIHPVDSLMEQMEQNGVSGLVAKKKGRSSQQSKPSSAPYISQEDMNELTQAATSVYRELAPRYYLEPDVEPQIKVVSNSLRITIPLVEAAAENQ